jgi:Fur family transcriptional regulator, ferric uptake regulator
MKAKPISANTIRGDTVAASQALAETQLRDASIRITAARVKVLATLLGARCALSHQDVQDTLADMDRVTLYRALDCLTDAGLAHKIAGDDRIFHYSPGAEHDEHGAAPHPTHSPSQHQHGHFKCTRCGKLFCLDSGGETGTGSAASDSAKRQSALRRQLQSALQETLGKGFQSHDIELTIKGWCADCAH